LSKTSEKRDFVRQMLATQPGMGPGKLSGAIRQRFGKGISFVHLKQLREALESGRFDRKWQELFGPGEPPSTAATQSPAPEKKVRGERRRKLGLVGRRHRDRDNITLRDIQGHLVVYRARDGFMRSQTFNSRKRAERMVKELLTEGVTADNIGYFRRNEILTTVVL
jgi:hypothetical protein